MKNYIGVKIVKAEPMTKTEYNKRRPPLSPLLDQNDEDGYIIRYPDGYVSWSPKDVFEQAYRQLDCEDFINGQQLIASLPLFGREAFFYCTDSQVVSISIPDKNRSVVLCKNTDQCSKIFCYKILIGMLLPHIEAGKKPQM